MLKEGFDLEPNYVSQHSPLPAQGPGSVLCCEVSLLSQGWLLALWAADAQALNLWALPAVAPWSEVPHHPAFSTNGLEVSTY